MTLMFHRDDADYSLCSPYKFVLSVLIPQSNPFDISMTGKTPQNMLCSIKQYFLFLKSFLIILKCVTSLVDCIC